jgi:hypothetical protein
MFSRGLFSSFFVFSAFIGLIATLVSLCGGFFFNSNLRRNHTANDPAAASQPAR